MDKLKSIGEKSFVLPNQTKPLKVVLTNKVIGQGKFGEVRVGYNKDNKSEGFAVKVVKDSRLKTGRAI